MLNIFKNIYILKIILVNVVWLRECRVAPCENDELISERSQDSRVQIHAFRTYGF